MNEIQEVKARIVDIDRQIGALQNERLIKGLRFALLLKQAALANPPVESQKQRATWADDLVGGSGFEDRPHVGTGFEEKSV